MLNVNLQQIIEIAAIPGNYITTIAFFLLLIRKSHCFFSARQRRLVAASNDVQQMPQTCHRESGLISFVIGIGLAVFLSALLIVQIAFISVA